MEYLVNKLNPNYNFAVRGVSYIGNPKMCTVMYVSKKISYLLRNLERCQSCLVFIEKGIEISDKLKEKNCFINCENPQLSYARFVNEFAQERRNIDNKRKYKLTDEGYYLGENVRIGCNAYIEIGCLIGHDVIIGANAVILSGSIIKNAIIGDDFFCNEKAIVGASGFTMCKDENGNNYRISTLGKVIIGNHVEIGTFNNISSGGCGDTIIEDYVKLDTLIHIGHEAHIHKNAELTAGIVVGGFADIGENVFIGINSSIRNRISVGSNSRIGMGSNVIRDVEEEKTMIGNPAKIMG